MSSPTQRTLAWLRDQGFRAEVVERHNSFSGRKTDLLGFIDILALNPDVTLGVQATSGSNVAARVAKIRDLDTPREWLAQGSRKIMVVGWKRYAKAEAGRWWRPIIREVTLADLEGL